MARRVTVCAGSILKDYEKNAPYGKIMSVEHVRKGWAVETTPGFNQRF